jgi:CheY-like chemotaxis protein
MRSQPWSADTTIIALTGWGQQEDKRRSEEAGFDHHLVKPVDPAVLEKLLVDLRAAKGEGALRNGDTAGISGEPFT